MSIYKRKSGRYAVVIAKAEGATQRRSLGTFATRKEAEKAERDALSARDRGVDIVPEKVTLGELMDRYLVDGEARGLSPMTLRGYRESARRCEPIKRIALAKLKPIHLSELYATLARDGVRFEGRKRGEVRPLSPKSIAHTHTFISTVLRWALRMELAMRNVADAVKPPQVPKKTVRHYERADALRLIEAAATSRYANLIIFAFETGLRRGELAGLRWSDVDFERRSALIQGAVGYVPGRIWYKTTKTNLVARIALSDYAIEALRQQKVKQAREKLAAGPLYKDEGFVFAPELGGMLSPVSISDALNKIAKKAKLSLRTVHGMRHSTASWLLRAGVDVRTVAAVLRHSSATTTLSTYAHEIEGAQAEAVQHLLGERGVAKKAISE